jgi:hypothetical protein
MRMGEDTWLFGLIHCSTRDMGTEFGMEQTDPKQKVIYFVDFINFFVC